MADNVNHPKHYADTTSIECIEGMQIAFGRWAVVNFCKCNAYKYLWRHKNKNGREDLEKAMWYCDRALQLAGGKEDEQITELVSLIHEYNKKESKT